MAGKRMWLAGALAVLALGACSSGSSDDSSSSSGAAAPAVAQDAARFSSEGDAAVSSAATAGADPAAGGGSAAGQTDRSVVRTAEIAIDVEGLGSAAAKVRSAAQAVGGTVASEVTDTESVLVLRVPEKSLDATLERLAGYGKQVSRSSTAQDVTADLADLNSRLDSQRRSVARVQALMSRADKLADVVMLEGELSSRQAELEALSARRAALADQAAMATVTVTLRTPATTPADDGDGFLAGLAAGWDALAASTRVALTVLGAVLPFAAILAVLAVALWQLRRRFARPPAATP